MNIEAQRQIGTNLRLLRHAYQYTQAEVAEELHIGRSTYTLYESGKKLPSTDMLVDLADFYHVRLDAFLDDRMGSYIQRAFSYDRRYRGAIHLVEIYYRLSAHGQGRLLERADTLLEGEGEKPPKKPE